MDEARPALDMFVFRLGEIYNSESLHDDTETKLQLAARFALDRDLDEAEHNSYYSLARLGFFARCVEWEQYPESRSPDIRLYARAHAGEYGGQAGCRTGAGLEAGRSPFRFSVPVPITLGMRAIHDMLNLRAVTAELNARRSAALAQEYEEIADGPARERVPAATLELRKRAAMHRRVSEQYSRETAGIHPS